MTIIRISFWLINTEKNYYKENYMSQYRYCGPVKEFDNIINSKWEATTHAFTEAKARNNLIYRYKREHGKTADCKITLPGKMELID